MTREQIKTAMSSLERSKKYYEKLLKSGVINGEQFVEKIRDKAVYYNILFRLDVIMRITEAAKLAKKHLEKQLDQTPSSRHITDVINSLPKDAKISREILTAGMSVTESHNEIVKAQFHHIRSFLSYQEPKDWFDEYIDYLNSES